MNTSENTILYLLKALLTYSNYTKYNSYVSEDFLKDNNKEIYKLLQVLKIYYDSFKQDISSIEEFEAFYFLHYPAVNQKDATAISTLLNRLKEIEVSPDVSEEIFIRHFEQVKATELSLLGLEVAEGKKDFSVLRDAAKKIEELRSLKPESDQFVSFDLSDLEKKALGESGLEWRLQTLNSCLGPLRKGDFGFIFKRPETGGTTLLASEISHFVGQTDRPILWFNNEEQGEKVALRCYQAYFGVTLNELLAKKEIYRKRFLTETADRIKIVDSATSTRSDIDDYCNRYNPSCIIFDQIDKIRGFSNDRNDLELQQIYQWGRELAKQFGPVIGICQAGVSAENKQYLTMDDVADSKTAKQGEADWILGIGKSHQPGLEHIRFFSICKNKLLGGPTSKEELRHGRTQVRIWPEKARYEDIPGQGS